MLSSLNKGSGIGHRINGEALVSAAHAHLVRRCVLGIDTRLLQRLSRDHQHAVVGLGHALEARGGVDHVADRGVDRRLGRAHGADDRDAGVDPDADAQRLLEVGGEAAVEPLDAVLHLGRAFDRGAAGGIQGLFQAVEGEQPVAAELRVVAAGRAQRRVHLGEELVHDEDRRRRAGALAQARRVAQVDEHRDDRALAPLRAAARFERAGGSDVGRKKRRHRDVARRARLAGEAHVGRSVDPRERLRFQASRRRQVGEPVAHAHPAGGAARAPAAHRGVRQAFVADRLEDRAPHRRGDQRGPRRGARGRWRRCACAASARAGSPRAGSRTPIRGLSASRP